MVNKEIFASDVSFVFCLLFFLSQRAHMELFCQFPFVYIRTTNSLTSPASLITINIYLTANTEVSPFLPIINCVRTTVLERRQNIKSNLLGSTYAREILKINEQGYLSGKSILTRR